MNALLDRIYDDFVGKVAEGRGLTRDRAHRWPAAASGPAPTPTSAAWWTSSAA